MIASRTSSTRSAASMDWISFALLSTRMSRPGSAFSAVTWPGRLRQVRAFFRARSPDQLLAAAAPWTSPWLPPGYEQNFWNAAKLRRVAVKQNWVTVQKNSPRSPSSRCSSAQALASSWLIPPCSATYCSSRGKSEPP